MTDTTLDDFMMGLPDVLAANIGHSVEDIAVANAFIPVHMDAVELLRVNTSATPTGDLALILLASHALNLYTSMLELALRGRFDVAWHLSRAVFDARSLAYAVAKGSGFAEKFLRDELKASEARKFALNDLKQTGYDDITDGLGDRWLRIATAANDLSHVNVSHLGAMVSYDGTAITPHFGGREDARSCRLLFASAHENELWFLTFIEHLRKNALSEDWSKKFLLAKVQFGEYWRGHKHEWEDAPLGQTK